MTYASLFAGIGGFDLALNRLGHECVYVNEWDKYACDTYERRFGHRPDSRDITTVPASDIPDHDILCGGFPCQAFSIAGKRKGFEEARGTLFFDIARIAKAKRPAYLFLENVKGLLNHDLGRTFEVILRTLDELGYDTQWQVVNSKDFGVPQNRERIIIISHLRGKPRPQVFPLQGEDRPTAQQSGVMATAVSYNRKTGVGKELEVAHTLSASDYRGLNRNQDQTAIIQVNNPTHSNNRVYDAQGISPTLNTMQGGNRQPKIVEGATIRRLTPIDCERLQGFPDNWTAGVSDTQRYKQLGNAVTVNVIYEIAKRAFGHC